VAKSFAIVVTSRECADIVGTFLPTAQLKAIALDQFYFLISTAGQLDCDFNDVSGQPLVQIHTFDTLAEAKAWVIGDCKLHLLMRSHNGTAQ
jgi:hypothetical protein